MATNPHPIRQSDSSSGLTRRLLLRLAGGTALGAGTQTLLPWEALAQPASAAGACSTTGLKVYFQPPANVDDFPRNCEHYRRLAVLWDQYVNQWTEQAILGNPWTSNLDSNRSYYFNPRTTPIPAGSTTKLVEWIAFPNRLTTYLGPPQYAFSQEQLFEFADLGYLIDPAQASSPIAGAGQTALPQIPQNVCPYVNSTPVPTMPYGPVGPRGWQDEYCEWAVERHEDGEIKRVMFTCENAEYWFALWTVSPEKVHELYRTLVNPKVQLADLQLRDAAGKVVTDPLTGRPAYNPLNKWNNSPRILSDSGGAVHLTSPPNSLPAEIGLGAAATLQRTEDTNPQEILCCTPYGQSFRHSDPHIGFTINEAVRGLNKRITIANPVGLYLQRPDLDSLELPSEWIQAGLKPQDFWHLERGVWTEDREFGLHLVFRAPEGRKDLKLSQIKIHGRPLRWGSQLTQTMQVGLYGTLIPPGTGVTQAPLGCPTAESPAPNRPAPLQLIPYNVLQAYVAANMSGNSSMASPVVKRGTTQKSMALVTTGTDADTAITFLADGIKAVNRRFLSGQRYHIPGNTNGGTYNLFVFDLEVASTAPIGPCALRLGTQFNTAAPAFLTVE